MFGDPTTTTGGNALKFYASQRLRITSAPALKEEEEAVGISPRITVAKNKVAPPFKKCQITIRFGEGIDRLKEIIDLSVDHDIIKKSGSWFSYEDTKIGQGFSAVKELLLDNEELVEEIKGKLFKELNIK